MILILFLISANFYAEEIVKTILTPDDIYMEFVLEIKPLSTIDSLKFYFLIENKSEVEVYVIKNFPRTFDNPPSEVKYDFIYDGLGYGSKYNEWGFSFGPLEVLRSNEKREVNGFLRFINTKYDEFTVDLSVTFTYLNYPEEISDFFDSLIGSDKATKVPDMNTYAKYHDHAVVIDLSPGKIILTKKE